MIAIVTKTFIAFGRKVRPFDILATQLGCDLHYPPQKGYKNAGRTKDYGKALRQ